VPGRATIRAEHGWQNQASIPGWEPAAGGDDRSQALSGLLPPAPAPPATGCPQLLPGRCDGPAVKVSHPPTRINSASRRTKPALNAFAITFSDRFPAAETY